MASLVGAQHVGIGLDCVFDENEVQDFVKNNPSTFPPKYGFTNDVVVAEPDQFSNIAQLLWNHQGLMVVITYQFMIH